MSRQQKRHLVRKKRSHIRTHDDELLCNEIGSQYGEELLPGFASAPMELIDSGLHRETGRDGWWYLRHEQTACMGVCGGPWDEHSVAPEKFPDTNSAKQMASYCHVEDDRAIKQMLAYSLPSDRGERRGPFGTDPILRAFGIAPMLKAVWRAGADLSQVLSLYHELYRSWYHVLSGKAPLSTPDHTFRQELARWTAKKLTKKRIPATKLASLANVPDALALVRWPRNPQCITQLLDLDRRTTGKIPFDLEGIWDSLWAAGTEPAVIGNTMETLLEAKYIEEERFHKAEIEFADNVQYLPPSDRHPYRVAVIRSDSDYINRACKNLDIEVDVLVMALSSGHHRIFCIHKHIAMAYVAAYLRANEFQKQYNRPCPLRQDILQRKGTLREVLQWYLSHDGLGVFCSTETSPGTPATEQVTREVAAGVEAGLAQAWSWHHDKPATKLFARRIAARRSRQEHTAASQ